MSVREIKLADIEAALVRLRGRQTSCTFEPAVEAFYQKQTRRRRAAMSFRMILTCLVGYNILLFVDWVLLPGTFWRSLALHFGLVTTFSVIAAFVMRAKPAFCVREATLALTPILIFIQVMIIYAMNTGLAADNYQYLVILDVILMNAVLRPDVRVAAATSVLIATGYVLLIWLVGAASFPTRIVGTVIMTTAVLNTLSGRRLMERDARASFLRQTQDRLRHEAIEALACRDGLTGLFNRRHLDKRLLSLSEMTEGREATIAMLMIDVDRFKAFNDRYGHLAGDMCLARVASAILAQMTHKDDIAVRYGGEEFLVLLARADMAEASRVAERIRCAIARLDIPHEASSCGVVTASFGVAAGPNLAHEASELIAAADTALYAAKRAGRNTVWPPFAKATATALAPFQVRQAS